jgi:prepilin-type N-terminal cleavage/methylation domain-containing protein
MLNRIREAKKNESGFTLIELLIVIVILGVLAAIVVFAVGSFNNDGKAAACKSDKKNVEIATEAFYAKSNPQAYPGDVNALVTAGYLREAPPTGNGYTITTSGGVVTATGACT